MSNLQSGDTSTTTVRQRLYHNEHETARYLTTLEKAFASSRAVQHPFLEWYANNRLTPNQERILFSECYYWFKDLPSYIARMSVLTRDARILREIAFNVLDEVGGDKTHAQLYCEFLEGVGLPLTTVKSFRPSRETIELNHGMEQLYSSPPIERALGALFFDEVMSAIMVGKVNDGLTHQGRTAAQRFFWQMHVDVEVGHSNSVFNAAVPLLGSPEARDIFEGGANELSRRVENFWDRVDYRLRGEHGERLHEVHA